MARIEVPTTQNVKIQYETAGFVLRFVAWCVDSAVVLLAFLVLVFLFYSMSLLDSDNGFAMLLLLLVAIKYFYALWIEIYTNGQSVGKKLAGISVIKLNGNALEMNDYLIRWAYRALDFGLSFFTIGSMSILMSEKHQRLGDMIANTSVVKIKPPRLLTLEDLQHLPDREAFIPRFPLVTQFTDEEMLALKQLLNRYQRYPNTTYAALLEATVLRLKEQLGAGDEAGMDDARFLREVISEYVILTR